jgi:hypothetical protein
MKKALDYNQPRNSYVKNEVAQKLLHSFVQAGTQLSSQMDFCSLFYLYTRGSMYLGIVYYSTTILHQHNTKADLHPKNIRIAT